MKYITDTVYMLMVYVLMTLTFIILSTCKAHAQDAELKERIIQSATKHGIDPNLALAIAEVESRFNRDTVGSLGEIGVYQLRPEYHYVIKGDDQQNIDTAMDYLVKMKRVCEEYREAFFICYNTGPRVRVKRPTKFPYYKKVKAAQERRQIASHDYRN